VFALSLALSAPSWAQAVHVVAGDGSGDFLQLQQAVTAAAAGDVILVRPFGERYDPTVIDGKALTIVGDGGIRPQLKRVRIRNLPAGSIVSLRFLQARISHHDRSESEPRRVGQGVAAIPTGGGVNTPLRIGIVATTPPGAAWRARSRSW
jgi:hypothetical protein